MYAKGGRWGTTFTSSNKISNMLSPSLEKQSGKNSS
jgi:hypothetical protein